MIEIKNVSKEFELENKEKFQALKNINLSINEGELILLQGASGSGKSTLLSLLVGLAKPTNGEIVVDKQRVSKLPDNFASIFRREKIGIVFQKFNLISNLTAKENVLVPLIPSNLSKEVMEEKTTKALNTFKIIHKQDVAVKNLSGGEQQRVAIARAIVNSPKIIVADEPTANLDKSLSQHFLEEVQILKKLGKTIIIATHDPLFEQVSLVDRVINIKDGKI